MSFPFPKTALFILLLISLAVNVGAVLPAGDIVVHSTPAGAFACIDTVDCNYTTATFTAAANQYHTVTVIKDGYLKWANTVYVTSGETSVVVADLQLNPDATGIQVSINPGGGQVCLDNTVCHQNVGTPAGNGTTLFNGVSVGPHTISVQADGFRTFTEQVYVSLGATSSIRIDLVPVSTATGNIQVTVSPGGGQVCLDNTPCRQNVRMPSGIGTNVFTGVSVGSHTISVQADGFLTYTNQVYVSPDSTSTLYINLVPVATMSGNIQVISTPDGATACVDGGNCLVTPGTFSGLSPGTYHPVVVSLPGYSSYSENAYVVMGQTTVVHALLPPPPQTGALVIRVNVIGSTVCLDATLCRAAVSGTGADISGTTDFTGVTANIPHTLSVTAGGYEPYTTQVTLSQNQVNTLVIALLPAGVPSVTTVVPSPVQTGSVPVPFPTRAGYGPVLPLVGLVLCGIVIFMRNIHK